MTVKELKEIIDNLPDSTEVYIPCLNGRYYTHCGITYTYYSIDDGGYPPRIYFK